MLCVRTAMGAICNIETRPRGKWQSAIERCHKWNATISELLKCNFTDCEMSAAIHCRRQFVSWLIQLYYYLRVRVEAESVAENAHTQKIYTTNQLKWGVRLNVSDISSQRKIIIENELIVIYLLHDCRPIVFGFVPYHCFFVVVTVVVDSFVGAVGYQSVCEWHTVNAVCNWKCQKNENVPTCTMDKSMMAFFLIKFRMDNNNK